MESRKKIEVGKALLQYNNLVTKNRNSFMQDKAWNLEDEINLELPPPNRSPPTLPVNQVLEGDENTSKSKRDKERKKKRKKLSAASTESSTEERKDKHAKKKSVTEEQKVGSEKVKRKKKKKGSSLGEKDPKRKKEKSGGKDKNGEASRSKSYHHRPSQSSSTTLGTGGLSTLPAARDDARRSPSRSATPNPSKSPLLNQVLSPHQLRVQTRSARSLSTVESRIRNYRMGALERLAKTTTASSVLSHPSFLTDAHNDEDSESTNSVREWQGTVFLRRSKSDPTMQNSWDYVPFFAPLRAAQEMEAESLRSSSSELSAAEKRERRQSRRKPESMDLSGLSDFGKLSPAARRINAKGKEGESGDESPNNGGEVVHWEDQVDESGRRLVRSGNMEGLLSVLIQTQNYEFMARFLVTHRWFIESKELMDLLRKRWDAYKEGSDASASTRTALQLRTLNTVKKWVEWHVEDFVRDEEMRTQLSYFLQSVNDTKGNFDKWTRNIYQSLLAEKQREQDEKEIPTVIGRAYDEVSLLQIHPRELARQITLVDYDLYRRVLVVELIRNAWCKTEQAHETAPNVLKIIDRFNKMCYWVATKIVSTANLKKRVAVVTRFIQLGRYLRELNNFHGLMIIYSALNFSSVQRLKATWKALNSKSRATLKEFDDLFFPVGNYRNYCTELARCQPPCVPILSILLGRLTSLEEVMKDRTEDGFVNFRKMEQLGKMLLEYMYKFKEEPYPFQRVESITHYLDERLSNDTLGDKELYEISKRIEPSREVAVRDIATTDGGSFGNRKTARFLQGLLQKK